MRLGDGLQPKVWLWISIGQFTNPQLEMRLPNQKLINDTGH